MLAAFTVSQSPFVDVHADEFVGQIRVHFASKLHGIVQGLFRVLECVADALLDDASDAAANLRPERASYAITSKRQRQSGLRQPPMSQIHYAMQPEMREQKLPLVNQQAAIHQSVSHRVDDLVKRHRHSLKIRLEQSQRQI